MSYLNEKSYLWSNMYGQHEVVVVGADVDLTAAIIAHGDGLALARVVHFVAGYDVTVRSGWKTSLGKGIKLW